MTACGHPRWPAKTLADGVPISTTVLRASVAQLAALPRPPGVLWTASRLPPEQQVYEVQAVLLRFSLASDGDIHLAIAEPGNLATTMIAEIPDPARMDGAPAKYREQVAATRAQFIRQLGTPRNEHWTPSEARIVIRGPLFFDLQGPHIVADQAAPAPNGVEIHPVLQLVIVRNRTTALRLRSG